MPRYTQEASLAFRKLPQQPEVTIPVAVIRKTSATRNMKPSHRQPLFRGYWVHRMFRYEPLLAAGNWKSLEQ